MEFNFKRLPERFQKPLSILGERYHFIESDSGREIEFISGDENHLKICADEHKIVITCGFDAAFYRGVCTVVQYAQKGTTEFELEEEVWFPFNGLMVDCSRNGVMNISYAKEMIEILSAMGLNVMMLYMEDVYELEGYPYFGYLRGRYSKEELKELDDYAYQFGVELIPCIQTLAHMDQFLYWEEMASKYIDLDNVLNVGSKDVKDLIENIITQLSNTFRSKRIHLGMDEAYNLGRGKYADEHGMRKKSDIMREHLEFILSICKKNGVRPIIWDDMFVREYAADGKVIIPDDMDLMYWDYYNNTKKHYIENIKVRKNFSNHVMFAGGAWKWTGYAPHHAKTFAATNASLAACKEEGIKEVMTTAWADDGCECPISAMLFGTVLFAEHGYKKEVSEEEFSEKLKFYTGMSFEEFMKQQEIDIYPEYEEKTATVTPGKYGFYEDPLYSMFVYHTRDAKGDITIHYQNLAQYFEKSAENQKNEALKAAQEFYAYYCDFMRYKWNLGLNIYDAYQKKDNKAILDVIEKQLVPAIERIDKVRLARQKEWNITNKIYGFEVLDVRMAGIKQRMETAKEVLMQYINGVIDKIEPLEEERLPVVPYREKGMGEVIHYNRSLRAMTPGKVVW